MTDVTQILNKLSLNCPDEEYVTLKFLYTKLENNKNDISLEFYNSIVKKTNEYISKINFNIKYEQSKLNYKINIIKLLIKSYKKSTDRDKIIEYIFYIFKNMLFILDNDF
jgi:hypothetical protein